MGEKKLDSLDRTLAYCKRMGITYAEYQKACTLAMLKRMEKKKKCKTE